MFRTGFQHGELGRGLTSTQATELDGVHPPADIRIASIHAGLLSRTQCGSITSDHDLWCWGDNSCGQLGWSVIRKQSTDPTPSLVPTVAHLRFLDVAIGQDQSVRLDAQPDHRMLGVECSGPTRSTLIRDGIEP